MRRGSSNREQPATKKLLFTRAYQISSTPELSDFLPSTRSLITLTQMTTLIFLSILTLFLFLIALPSQI
jgi:hypothetical protein